MVTNDITQSIGSDLIPHISSLTPWIITVQGLGLLGAVFELYAATHKHDQGLVRNVIISGLILAVHYAFLGAWPAFVSDLITALRFYLSRFKSLASIFWAFLSFYILSCAVLADNVIETFPFMASILGTVGLYRLSGIPMRVFFAVGQALWLFYCLSIASWGGILLYFSVVLITLSTILRLAKDRLSLKRKTGSKST